MLLWNRNKNDILCILHRVITNASIAMHVSLRNLLWRITCCDTLVLNPPSSVTCARKNSSLRGTSLDTSMQHMVRNNIKIRGIPYLYNFKTSWPPLPVYLYIHVYVFQWVKGKLTCKDRPSYAPYHNSNQLTNLHFSYQKLKEYC